ncbi:MULTISPECIES: PTS sugar transporter subunit IIA [unclassified Roseivivax]|uniref:PTS sugar transporter subunit IIA n=1 Tax=Roseivivax sp. GX 12232 TaxID=2900547 RepID=UPI001E57244E|nr:PTS sugar transporter subunit IIA [Roseivivax sp. GX 12232]MCE0505471.1 PTS sugar transporter subunit IIA [Roseivivax sp. GX 12232]
MKFVDLLVPQAVKVMGASSSKKRVMHDLADVVESAYGIAAPQVVEALMERESLGCTGVGHGVALPHARLPGIHEVKGVFLLLEKPVDFDAVDRQPVDVVFGLFAPEDAGVEHLKALALVSRTLRDAAFCGKLRANPDAGKLYTILTEAQSVQAA